MIEFLHFVFGSLFLFVVASDLYASPRTAPVDLAVRAPGRPFP